MRVKIDKKIQKLSISNGKGINFSIFNNIIIFYLKNHRNEICK